jgi:hypothetical protein
LSSNTAGKTEGTSVGISYDLSKRTSLSAKTTSWKGLATGVRTATEKSQKETAIILAHSF